MHKPPRVDQRQVHQPIRIHLEGRIVQLVRFHGVPGIVQQQPGSQTIRTVGVLHQSFHLKRQRRVDAKTIVSAVAVVKHHLASIHHQIRPVPTKLGYVLLILTIVSQRVAHRLGLQDVLFQSIHQVPHTVHARGAEPTVVPRESTVSQVFAIAVERVHVQGEQPRLRASHQTSV